MKLWRIVSDKGYSVGEIWADTADQALREAVRRQWATVAYTVELIGYAPRED